MRLWSLHSRHLDAKVLVALWREALLAQTILSGLTDSRLPQSPPQLTRFKQQADPLAIRCIPALR
ncbi:MAG TPA: pyrimidine dimer DNA glycosylase/endonuclease V [Gallionellaceae bacterium]|nr:pyrimidine dimer DNA glycosylase/endonuclease V [Gallionellaceae bacterium]